MTTFNRFIIYGCLIVQVATKINNLNFCLIRQIIVCDWGQMLNWDFYLRLYLPALFLDYNPFLQGSVCSSGVFEERFLYECTVGHWVCHAFWVVWPPLTFTVSHGWTEETGGRQGSGGQWNNSEGTLILTPATLGSQRDTIVKLPD